MQTQEDVHIRDKPVLLMIGTPRFHNPTHNIVNTKVVDVTTPERQREFEEVAETLATFRPTRIAVVWTADAQTRLDERYADFLAGRHRLEVTETEQIGFRLAEAQGRLQANIEGLAAADLALKGVRAEYGFGQRSTIDILVADQSFRAAQLAVARSRSDMLVAQAALLRATGRLGRDAYA